MNTFSRTDLIPTAALWDRMVHIPSLDSPASSHACSGPSASLKPIQEVNIFPSYCVLSESVYSTVSEGQFHETAKFNYIGQVLQIKNRDL